MSIQLPVTVYDSHGDGMNQTEIHFNAGTEILKDGTQFENKTFESVNFLCGENTYVCKGTYSEPNYREELSFKVQDQTYSCEDCTQDAKCAFVII